MRSAPSRQKIEEALEHRGGLLDVTAVAHKRREHEEDGGEGRWVAVA